MPVTPRSLASGRALIGQRFVLISTLNAGSPSVQLYQWNRSGGLGPQLAGTTGSGMFASSFDGMARFPSGIASDRISIADAGDILILNKYWSPVTGIIGTAGWFDYAIAYIPSYTAVAQPSCISFSPNGQYVAFGMTSTPYIQVRRWTAQGFGVAFSDPGTLPPDTVRGIKWSPDGNWIACVHNTTPFVTSYPWSDSGFGTKVSNPATLPGGNGTSLHWSPGGAYLAVSFQTTAPFVRVYPWSAGFGTAVADPVGSSGAGIGRRVRFSPDGAYIAMAGGVSPFVYVWPWAAGFGTKVADPVSLPLTLNVVEWTPDGQYIICGYAAATSPRIAIYPWSAGFGTKLANPATVPAAAVGDIDFFW